MADRRGERIWARAAGAGWVTCCGGLLLTTGILMGAKAGEPGAERAVPADSEVRFSRDIRPILADRCFKCHGPDEAAKEATGLRLDSFEGATADLGQGARALVPGDSGASLIMQRLRHADPESRMPPLESKLTMTNGEIDLIERWIAQGGKYEEHWAFKAPVRPALPDVKDADWVRNPIDHFILARLEKDGIAPLPRPIARR